MDTWMWIIGQTIIIAFAIVGAFMRIQVSIARLEGKVEVLAVQQGITNQKLEGNDEQHKALAAQVNGISRTLALMEGMEMVRGKETQGV
jgi:hypothetical protein